MLNEKISMSNKIPVAIIGATGAVGQRFIQLLTNHPTFEIVGLGASDRSEGKRYVDAAHWILDTEIPIKVRNTVLIGSNAEAMSKLPTPPRFMFSALPNDLARDIEPAFAQAGMVVFSNASYYRMGQDIPLVIPEVNWQHLNLIKAQREQRGWSGGIVCNTNCTVSGPAMSLRPLHEAFGIQRVFTVSMQAISGAGYPGVPSLDIYDNVVPFIKNEEEKVEQEAQKLLGKLGASSIEAATFPVSAHCNRVAVIDGHIVTMSVELATKATAEDAARVMRDFRCTMTAGLPMAPEQPIVVRDEPDRPQPRKDRLSGAGRAAGMPTVVGRVRPEPLFGDYGVKFITLAHNTIRGAAGGSILNAEVFVKMGL